MTKKKRLFDRATLQLAYNQMRKSRTNPFKINVVLFKIKTDKQRELWSNWLLNCPKDIDFEVKY